MNIKKLEFINVREIWKHEALDFTRWLASNIDYIEDKLGFSINVIETEKQIGSFNVDILVKMNRVTLLSLKTNWKKQTINI